MAGSRAITVTYRGSESGGRATAACLPTVAALAAAAHFIPGSHAQLSAAAARQYSHAHIPGSQVPERLLAAAPPGPAGEVSRRLPQQCCLPMREQHRAAEAISASPCPDHHHTPLHPPAWLLHHPNTPPPVHPLEAPAPSALSLGVLCKRKQAGTQPSWTSCCLRRTRTFSSKLLSLTLYRRVASWRMPMPLTQMSPATG